MMARETLRKIFFDEEPYKSGPIDYEMKALNLLRNKIPYDVCKSIIGGAGHDEIYLCDVDEVLPYINEEDVLILADCNLFIDEDNDCLSMYV